MPDIQHILSVMIYINPIRSLVQQLSWQITCYLISCMRDINPIKFLTEITHLLQLPETMWHWNFPTSLVGKGHAGRGGAIIGAGEGVMHPHLFPILVFLLYWSSPPPPPLASNALNLQIRGAVLACIAEAVSIPPELLPVLQECTPSLFFLILLG